MTTPCDYEREHITTLMETEQRSHRLRVYGWSGAIIGWGIFWYMIGRLV